jgi:hypothetical protein
MCVRQRPPIGNARPGRFCSRRRPEQAGERRARIGQICISRPPSKDTPAILDVQCTTENGGPLRLCRVCGRSLFQCVTSPVGVWLL